MLFRSGAAATAEYFMSLYPYVYATGDLEPWRDMTMEACVFCQSVVDKVTVLHAAGGWREHLQQHTTATRYEVSTEDSSTWVVSVDVSHPEGVEHDGGGGTARIAADALTFLVQLHWTGQEWVVEGGNVS